jgi:replication factor C subunit 3/5
MFYNQTTRSNAQTQLPWVEKYRPSTIDNIVSHEEILKALKNFIRMRTLPHLLFFGPSGSGKTSTIMCWANDFYGNNVEYMVMRLNASNERGIETVRTKIKNFVSNQNNIMIRQSVHNTDGADIDIFKLVILDEIDSMTVEAQGMLRQTIEKHSSTARFCLICNEIDKINPALQSRCTPFRFAPLKPDNMITRLEEICKSEGLKCEAKAIKSIVDVSNGDMRNSINLLQSIAMTTASTTASTTCNKKINNSDVYKISGNCMPSTIKQIFEIITENTRKKSRMNFCEVVENICEIMGENNATVFNLLDILKDIILESDFTLKQKIYLIDNLATNEIYDSININYKTIVINIISLFVIANDIK